MKKIYLIFALLSGALFTACDPVEDDYGNNTSGIASADDIKVTVTVETQNGKNVNRVHVDADGNAVPIQLSNGVNIAYAPVADFLLFNKGENTIYISAQNPDGAVLSKEIVVNVDEMTYEVDPTYGILCGSGEKVWTWDMETLDIQADTGEPRVWGNCGYLSSSHDTFTGWWGVGCNGIPQQISDYGYGLADGGSATMTFILNGLRIEKSSGGKGTFSFDMSATTTAADGSLWSIGKLYTTGESVLFPIMINAGTKVQEYDIMTLDEGQLYLSAPSAGASAWGEATFWRFKAVD